MRLSRCRSVWPKETGTRAVPESTAKAASLRIAWRGAIQQDLGAPNARQGSSAIRARDHVLDDRGDLRIEVGGDPDKCGDPLASPEDAAIEFFEVLAGQALVRSLADWADRYSRKVQQPVRI